MFFIKGVSSAFPKYFYKQDDIIEFSKRIFSENTDFSKMLKVYKNSGVKSRFLVNDLEWYLKKNDWKEFRKNSGRFVNLRNLIKLVFE